MFIFKQIAKTLLRISSEHLTYLPFHLLLTANQRVNQLMDLS